MNKIDVNAAKDLLSGKSYIEVIDWVKLLDQPIMASTSFGPNSAVMLHMISVYLPETPIIWVDSGYNLKDTYVVAEQLMSSLNINMKIYTPEITAERRNALMGGIPDINDPLHQKFTDQVKLAPFKSAVDDIDAQIWLTGIRQSDTSHRKEIGQVSYNKQGLLRVSPIFYWTDQDIEEYMKKFSLPTCKHYFDPTKAEEGRECGLHL
jgi:phosphoadenosine phosphosulfate reductase